MAYNIDSAQVLRGELKYDEQRVRAWLDSAEGLLPEPLVDFETFEADMARKCPCQTGPRYHRRNMVFQGGRPASRHRRNRQCMARQVTAMDDSGRYRPRLRHD